MLGGTALLLLLTQWLVPRLATWWLALLGLPTPGPAPTVSTGALISWLILVVNISFGAFDLSPADLTNAAAGVGPTLGAFFIFAVVVGLIWSPTTVATTMARLTLPIDGALGLALVINLSLCGILGAIHRGAQ